MLMQISGEACLHLFLPNFEASSGYAQVVSEPNLPPYDENGNPYWLLENTNFTAPLSILNYDGSNNALSLSTSFNGSYRVWNQLAVKLQAGYNYSSSDQQDLYLRSYYHPLSTTAYNQARYYTMNTSTLIVEPQLTFNCEILGGKTDFLLGTTYQSSDTHVLYLYGQYLHYAVPHFYFGVRDFSCLLLFCLMMHMYNSIEFTFYLFTL